MLAGLALPMLGALRTNVQHRIYVERLQIVADVRAGGEERGAADPPWNYSPLVGSDVITALNFPVAAAFLPIASQLVKSTLKRE
jgi:hypothetical protein